MKLCQLFVNTASVRPQNSQVAEPNINVLFSHIHIYSAFVKPACFAMLATCDARSVNGHSSKVYVDCYSRIFTGQTCHSLSEENRQQKFLQEVNRVDRALRHVFIQQVTKCETLGYMHTCRGGWEFMLKKCSRNILWGSVLLETGVNQYSFS